MRLDFNFNNAFKEVLNFLKTPANIRISCTLVGAGVMSLVPDILLEILLTLLQEQNIVSTSRLENINAEPNHLIGWPLIGSGILLYLLTRKDIPTKGINEISREVSDNLTESLTETGYRASHLQNREIIKIVDNIQKLRYYSYYPTVEKSCELANRIIEGDLSGASPEIKARNLAKLARYTSKYSCQDESTKFLEESKKIAPTIEARQAEYIQFAFRNKAIDKKIIRKLIDETDYSTVFVIKNIVDGPEKTVDWFFNTQSELNKLTDETQAILLINLLSLEKWDQALYIANQVNKECINESPVLANQVATSFFVNTIKDHQLRKVAVHSIPLRAKSFPFSDDPDSIKLRSRSVELFEKCKVQFQELDADELVNLMDCYSLWINLKDSQNNEKAYGTLSQYFNKYNYDSLKYLQLAFQFDLKIDYEKIEQIVNRESELRGIDDFHLSVSRFVLAHKQKKPLETINYIRKHKAQIELFIHPSLLLSFELDTLLALNRAEEAEILLEKYEKKHACDEVQLRNLIQAKKGENKSALAMRAYKDSGETQDLINLVNTLNADQNNLEDRYQYSLELFYRTGSKLDAIKVCDSAIASRRMSELDNFIDSNNDLVFGDDNLKLHYAWYLYRKGKFKNAKEILKRLKSDNFISKNTTGLEINLCVHTGDWEGLNSIIQNSWENKEHQSEQDLQLSINLAKVVYPERVMDLLEFITAKYSTNPDIFTSSYSSAVSMGFEKDQIAGEWFNKAIKLSDESGPIKTISFDELVDFERTNYVQIDKYYNAYLKGKIPSFIAAFCMNIPVAQMYLERQHKNRESKDIRDKHPILAFSSSRTPVIINEKTIVVDITSVLTLESLGILELLFSCFEAIIITHSFMIWLWEDSQKIGFNQPSRIREAEQLYRLISDGVIRKLEFTGKKNPSLALDIGEELSEIISEAQEKLNNGDEYTYAICPYPIYKIGQDSQTVNLSKYENILASPLQLIKQLKIQNLITSTEYNRYHQHLSQYDREWPKTVSIKPGSKLFIDHISLHFLSESGVLDSLKSSGYKLFIHGNTIKSIRSLLNTKDSIEKSSKHLKNIRSIFSKKINSSEVIVSEMYYNNDLNDDYLRPFVEIYKATEHWGATIIDDQYTNKNSTINFEKKSTRIYSSLDFIETIYNKKLISLDEKYHHISLLRDAGYTFIPVTSNELIYHLENSNSQNNSLTPSKELNSFKQNFQLLKVNNTVRIPRDIYWLDCTRKIIIETILNQWNQDIFSNLKIPRSNWLFELLDIRGWSHLHETHEDSNIAQSGEYLKAAQLLLASHKLNNNYKEEYLDWLDLSVLTPMKYKDSRSYYSLIKLTDAYITDIYKDKKLTANLPGEQTREEAKTYIIRELILDLPPKFGTDVLNQSEFKERFKEAAKITINITNEIIQFDAQAYFKALMEFRKTNNTSPTLIDSRNTTWEIKSDPLENSFICLHNNKDTLKLTFPWLLEANNKNIEGLIKRELSKRNFLKSEYKFWTTKIPSSKNDINYDNALMLLLDAEICPYHIQKTINSKQKNITDYNSLTLSDLAPNQKKYFYRLIGQHSQSENINEYSKNEFYRYIESRIKEEIDINDLLSCFHPSLCKSISYKLNKEEDFYKFANHAIKTCHPILVISCIEIGLINFSETCNFTIKRLYEKLHDENMKKNIKELLAFYVLINGEISKNKTLHNEPSFYRNLASLTQASLMHLTMLENGNSIEDPINWAYRHRGSHFEGQRLLDLKKNNLFIPLNLDEENFLDDFFLRIYSLEKKINSDIHLHIKDLIQKDSKTKMFYRSHNLLNNNMSLQTLPPEIEERIKKLLEDKSSPEIYDLILTSTTHWKVPEVYINEFIGVLSKSNYRITPMDENLESLNNVFAGLSISSCNTRNEKLANAVFCFYRVYKNFLNVDLDPIVFINIGFTAATAFTETDIWANYIGEWCRELVHSINTSQSATITRNYLEIICTLEPYLYYTCSDSIEILKSLEKH